MRWVRDRHADHPIRGEAGCGRFATKAPQERDNYDRKNLNLGLTTTLNERLIGFASPRRIRSAQVRAEPLADVHGRSGHVCSVMERTILELSEHALHRPAALDDVGGALGEQLEPDGAAEFARAIGRTGARRLDDAATRMIKHRG